MRGLCHVNVKCNHIVQHASKNTEKKRKERNSLKGNLVISKVDITMI